MNNAALLFVSKVVQKFCLKTELQLTPGTLTAFNFWYIFFYLQILVASKLMWLDLELMGSMYNLIQQ